MLFTRFETVFRRAVAEMISYLLIKTDGAVFRRLNFCINAHYWQYLFFHYMINKEICGKKKNLWWKQTAAPVKKYIKQKFAGLLKNPAVYVFWAVIPFSGNIFRVLNVKRPPVLSFAANFVSGSWKIFIKLHAFLTWFYGILTSPFQKYQTNTVADRKSVV